MDTLKTCSKCTKEFPATTEYFNKRNGSKDGLRGYCRKCHVRYAMEWGKANPDQYAENQRHSTSAYRARNRELVLERTREWKAKNPDNARNYRAAHRASFTFYSKKRRNRKANLPNTLTHAQWQFALDYFGGRCAVCRRPLNGIFHAASIDHWIPISDPRCPGSVAANAIPLCHGIGGCNNSKNDRDPEEWLLATFGKKRAKIILARILAYITSVSN